MADEPSFSEKVASATLMLLLEQRDSEQRDRLRDEELLASAGFDANEIGQLLDKKPSAVRMTLSRARAKKG